MFLKMLNKDVAEYAPRTQHCHVPDVECDFTERVAPSVETFTTELKDLLIKNYCTVLFV